MATQDDYIRTALRVPPELHAQIHESAKVNNRTFNAEIVARLEGSFAPTSPIGGQGGSMAQEITRMSLEQRVMDMLLEQSHIEINMMWTEDQIFMLREARTDRRISERKRYEAERSLQQRKAEHLQSSISTLVQLAQQNGIHIDTEELMNPDRIVRTPGFQDSEKSDATD